MRTTRCLFVSLACALAGPSDADPLDGEFALDFGYENAVWGPGSSDVSEECDETGCFSGDFAVDQRGKVTGGMSFTLDFVSDGIHVTGGMNGDFKGKVKGKNAVAQMTLTSKPRGVLMAPGYPDLPLKGAFSMLEVLDGNAMTSTLSGSVKLCAKGAGCQKDALPVEVTPLGAPEEGGGPWTLDLLLGTDAKGVISGTALASFPDGSAPIHFQVKGKYDAKKDESSLKLASDDPGPGATLKFSHVTHVAPDTTFEAYQVKYKICGQSGQRVVP